MGTENLVKNLWLENLEDPEINLLLLTYGLSVSSIVKRLYDHSNSSKGKYLIGASLKFRG